MRAEGGRPELRVELKGQEGGCAWGWGWGSEAITSRAQRVGEVFALEIPCFSYNIRKCVIACRTHHDHSG